jgi:hypothetical protein
MKLPTGRFSVFNHGALNRSASEKSKQIKHFRDYDGADKDRFLDRYRLVDQVLIKLG